MIERESRPESANQPEIRTPAFLIKNRIEAHNEVAKMERIKSEVGADQWMDNLDSHLVELFPKDAEIVGQMIRDGIKKNRASNWDDALEAALYPRYRSFDGCEEIEEQLKADPSLQKMRPFSEIREAKAVVEAHVEQFENAGKKGLAILREPRNKKMKSLERKMTNGMSTIDDWIDYQMLRDDPDTQPDWDNDPYTILFSSLYKNKLPYQLEQENANQLDNDTNTDLFRNLKKSLYPLKDYAMHKGNYEGFSYALGEDNAISELMRKRSQ